MHVPILQIANLGSEKENKAHQGMQLICVRARISALVYGSRLKLQMVVRCTQRLR